MKKLYNQNTDLRQIKLKGNKLHLLHLHVITVAELLPIFNSEV